MSVSNTYILPEILDLPATAELYKHMLELAGLGGNAAMDGSKVERIATPGIQCLISATTSFREAGRQFTVLSPSPALLAALADMGLSQSISHTQEKAI